jgi:Protein of unknown function (DUF3120)
LVNNTWSFWEQSQSDQWQLPISKRWGIFALSSFLVSIPVFIQAPLVRNYPLITLILTLAWVASGWKLSKNLSSQIWGDLLLGFSWSWFAGSIYWGWFRFEPLIHLPIEAIAVPFAIFCIRRGWGLIGNWFYLGSLFGTIITDIYFYLTGVIPHWRQLMQTPPDMVQPIFQNAIAQIRTPWGAIWAMVLVTILLILGLLPLKSQKLHWWSFSGAVLSTLLVDGLFWLVACFA